MTTTETGWRIDLPFVSPPLRDNQRLHWAKKAAETKHLRRDALMLATSAQLPVDLTFVEVTLHWQPSTNRRRDALSIAPTLKPLVDGLTDYGLVADDDIGHVRPSCCVHSWKRGVPAACWLTIREATR